MHENNEKFTFFHERKSKMYYTYTYTLNIYTFDHAAKNHYYATHTTQLALL